VIPLSLLAHQFPNVLDALKEQLTQTPSRRNNRFALRLEYNEVLLSRCSAAELRAWDMLEKQPIELEAVVATDRELARAIGNLQRMGLVIYSGFTPTDAAHVLGLSSHWNREAAELAALIWARQMRQVYGMGRWQSGDAVTPSQDVFAQVNQRIGLALIEAGLHQHNKLDRFESKSLTGLLAELVYESSHTPDKKPDAGSLFHLRFAADYPVVAVGAPAATFFPDAADHLGIDLTLPEHAEVANAFGAVMGSVVQRAHVIVTQPLHGMFIVHSDQEPIQFSKLEEATETAKSIAAAKVQGMAQAAGADVMNIKLSQDENHVHNDIDGDLFLETRITATAIGQPMIQKNRSPRSASDLSHDDA
jgi:N-methylhydantoinase A/oxoprolinase/acetone carboxylase beta subunit